MYAALAKEELAGTYVRRIFVLGTMTNINKLEIICRAVPPLNL